MHQVLLQLNTKIMIPIHISTIMFEFQNIAILWQNLGKVRKNIFLD